MKREKKDDREGEGTKFTLDRKIFSSDIWFASPWKLKIWIYLVGHANHKDGHFMGIPIKRGQLIRSYRTIAKDCSYKVGYRLKKPSLDTVKRVCEELTKELRIERRSVHLGALVTICNYNELQPFKKHEPNDEPNNSRTVTVQDKNVNNVLNTLPAKKADPDVKTFILEWVEIWSNKFGKPYTPNWGKEGKLVKEMFKVHSLQELTKLRAEYFKSEDSFIQEAGYSIGVFKTQLNKLIANRKLDPVEQARKEMVEYEEKDTTF